MSQPSSVYYVDRLALYNGETLRHGYHDFGGTSLRRQTTDSKFIFRRRYLHEGDPEDSDLFNFLIYRQICREAVWERSGQPLVKSLDMRSFFRLQDQPCRLVGMNRC
jgi:hypothetical protein